MSILTYTRQDSICREAGAREKREPEVCGRREKRGQVAEFPSGGRQEEQDKLLSIP